MEKIYYNEDIHSIIDSKIATDKINIKAFELANKLKSILVAIGYSDCVTTLNGVKIVIDRFHNNKDGIFTHIGIFFNDNEKPYYLDIDEPFQFRTVSGEIKTTYPSSFQVNHYFLEHANGIFNEVKILQEKHEKDALNILGQVKDL